MDTAQDSGLLAETPLPTQDKLALLLRIGQELHAGQDLAGLLQVLGDLARDILEAERCSIFLYDKSRGELWTIQAHQTEQIRVPVHRGIVGYTALTKQIQIVSDAYSDFRFNPEIDNQTGYQTRTLLTVPVLDTHKNLLGVFQALNKRFGAFTGTDAELLLLIAEYAAATLERAYLNQQLQETQTKLIHKLAIAAEFRDEDTSKHTKRVALYSTVLGREYGLAPKDLTVLQQVAPMHDLGKIGIPDNILLKAGPLSTQEFETIKGHSMIGYRILYDEANPVLQTAAIVARDHHEWWDGSGYPLGLKGEKISVFGRIVGIADCFDALCSSRPYKQAWPLSKTLPYIKSLRGRHFDPHLVDLFSQHLDELLDIQKYHQDA